MRIRVGLVSSLFFLIYAAAQAINYHYFLFHEIHRLTLAPSCLIRRRAWSTRRSSRECGGWHSCFSHGGEGDEMVCLKSFFRTPENLVQPLDKYGF